MDRVLLPGLAAPSLFGVALSLSLAVSFVRTCALGRPSLFDVAVLADERLGFRERVSSALHVQGLVAAASAERPASSAERELEALLGSQAAGCLERAVFAESFPLRLPRVCLWAAALALVNWGLSCWLPSFDIMGVGGEAAATARSRKAVEEEKKNLERRLAALEKEAEKNGALEERKLLELLREALKEAARENAATEAGKERSPGGAQAGSPQKEAMVQLTRHDDRLREGRESKKFESLERALESLKALKLTEAQLTRELKKALKEGDFEKAGTELAKLKERVEALSKKDSSQLTPGEEAELRQLADELARLARDSSALSSLSQALSSSSNAMNAGDFSAALDGMSLSAEEISRLSQLASEMEVLDQALDLVRLSKAALAEMCPECGTRYCPECLEPQCACKPGSKPGGT